MADLPEAAPWPHALCIVCGGHKEIALSLPGARIPRLNGYCQGIAVCVDCMHRITHGMPQDGEGDGFGFSIDDDAAAPGSAGRSA